MSIYKYKILVYIYISQNIYFYNLKIIVNNSKFIKFFYKKFCINFIVKKLRIILLITYNISNL